MKKKLLVNELEERITLAQQAKKRIIAYEEKILSAYHEGIINAKEYHEAYNKPIEGKNIETWHQYYDEYIETCAKKIRREENKKKNKKNSILIISFILLAGLFFLMNPYLSLTGHATSVGVGLTLTLNPNGPYLETITTTPTLQGLGLIVNITANITDPEGISGAILEVENPNSQINNYTMSNQSTTYTYEYYNWTNGTYHYRIYANDTNGDWNTTTIYNFTLQQNLTIQVQTLKVAYGINEQVNLTDPPGGTP